MLSTKLIDLFDRLRAYSVEEWGNDYGHGPRALVPWRDAEILSSELKDGNHIVALDIDYDAHLIPSSTPGHWHLYLDVPGGIPKRKYMRLIKKLGKYGVIEPGYATASTGRGYTALRVPGVPK